MKKRSRIFALFSLVFIAAGLSLPLQPMLIYELNLGDLPWLMQRLSLFHAFTLGLCLISAYTAWNASSAFVYAGPMTVVSVVFLNLFVSTDWKDVPNVVWGANVALAAVFLFFLKRNVREVLLDPTKRWWLTRPRTRVRLRTVLSTWSNDKIFGHSADLSPHGIFIELTTTQSAELNALRRLEVGKMIHLKLDLGPLYVLHLQAQVVRKVVDPVRPQQGLGLRFVGVSKFEQRQISDVLSQTGRFPVHAGSEI